MVDLVLGIGAAVGASTFYSLGIALQAMDAKEAPHEEHLRLALVRGLLRRARWLTGHGPVDPRLAAAGAWLCCWRRSWWCSRRSPRACSCCCSSASGCSASTPGAPSTWRRCAIVIGVIGAGLFAPPRSASQPGRQLTITLVLVGLAVASLLPYLLRALGHSLARADDDLRRPGVRLERRGDQARLRRPLRAPSWRRPRYGACRRPPPRRWGCSAR